MRVSRRMAKRASAIRKLGESRFWARVGAEVTFRAELMPGRDPGERTFTVARIFASGRIELVGLAGEHAEAEFEAAH